MANFKIGENGLDISSFDLPLNRAIKLVQWGGDVSGKKLALTLNQSTTAVELTVLSDTLPAASTAFTVKGKQSGATVSVCAYVQGPGSTQKYSEDLVLNVRGQPVKHPGYSVDMLSDLAISGNAAQIHTYSQIIVGPNSDRHLLSQRTTGRLNCGDVAGAYGSKIFSKKTSTTYLRYYLTPTSDKMADLKFDASMITKAIGKIKAFVSQGISVRLWAIYDDGFAKVIAGDLRTHFLTVIGYRADRFLYFDPWPGGSKLQYDGGMYPKTWNSFMGELVFDAGVPSNGINSPAGSTGLHKYRIIAGP